MLQDVQTQGGRGLWGCFGLLNPELLNQFREFGVIFPPLSNPFKELCRGLIPSFPTKNQGV